MGHIATYVAQQCHITAYEQQHQNDIFIKVELCHVLCSVVLIMSPCHGTFYPPHGFPPSLGGGLLFKDPLGLKEKPSDAPRPKAPTTRVVRLTTGQLIDYDYPKPDFLS